MKKFITFLISMLLICMTACTKEPVKQSDEESVNPQLTTILKVGNFNGGYGTEWLYKAAKRFEKEYEEYSFEEGKVGVKVEVNPTQDAGTTLYTKIKSSQDHVVFTEFASYYDFVGANLFLDITDVMQSVGTDGKSIESKLTEDQKMFYKTKNKYYAVPHYFGSYGYTYDIKLFEDKGFYLLEDGSFSQPKMFSNGKYNGTGRLATGPDGKSGTVDDGLPATYDDFFNLCKYMNQKGVTPITWTGQYSDYSNWGLCAMFADYEGLEQFKLNYTFDGTAKNLISVADDGTVSNLGDVTITPASGYKMYQSAGRYYAYTFMERIIRNHYYDTACFNSTVTHTDAQDNFLLSCEEGTPIAMLADGIWWQNEATETFNYMGSYMDESYSMQNRRLGFLPYPKATEEKVGEKITLVDSMYSFGAINGNIDSKMVEVAKKFLAFCYTDTSLQEFTTTVGVPKSLNYDLTDSQYESLTPYSQTVWNYYKSADIVLPYAQSDVYINKQGDFIYRNSLSNSKYFLIATELKNNVGLTAATLFNEMQNQKSESFWETVYAPYI